MGVDGMKIDIKFNNRLQKVIYHTCMYKVIHVRLNIWLLMVTFFNENMFLFYMSNMSKGFCVLKFPFLLVLINSYDMVNVHISTWTVILYLLEVYSGISWEKKYLKPSYKVILSACVSNISRIYLKDRYNTVDLLHF